MKPVFSKDSQAMKITETELLIYQQVVELKFNERTGLNKLFDNDFKLAPNQYQLFQPYLFSVLNEVEEKYFVKALLCDSFNLTIGRNKNKVFIKGYNNQQLNLEITLTSMQYEALDTKYQLDLTMQERPFYLIYAGTFSKNSAGVLCSKLSDLKLIKLAYN